MFTGIIRHVGTVVSVTGRQASQPLTVETGALAACLVVGDSVNVDGVCLTATRVEGGRVRFDVGAETMRLTTLGELREGDSVNLEPSLRVGDPLGGHYVTGHVDGVGTIARKEALPGEVRLAVRADADLTGQMVLKGSVAVDGISLTIAGLEPASFEVSLIPHTLAVTTLRHKGVGGRVNIECDMLGRYVRRFLAQGSPTEGKSPLGISELEDQGF